MDAPTRPRYICRNTDQHARAFRPATPCRCTCGCRRPIPFILSKRRMKGPHLLVGSDALAVQLPSLLERRGWKRLLIAAGPHFLESIAGAAFITSVKDRTASLSATPQGLLRVSTLKEQAAALPAGIDAVIAIGGGRSIDYAKALLYYAGLNPEGFVAVPTTAGSGSDATSFAVVYEGIDKLSIAGPELLPNVVVWDESLLRELPQRQRAVSGLDALVQCLESLWSLQSTGASRALAWEAGNWLHRNLETFVAHPGDELALAALYAAHHSGRAINTSRTTGPHALSYYLTAVHGIDHGHAVALLFPVFLQYNSDATESFTAVLELLGQPDADSAVHSWQGFLTRLGLEPDLASLGLTPAIIPEWLRHVNAERFANNPVPFEPARLGALLQTTLFL
ncbi:MAG: iron-containing alcohol dehydrogenase [Sphingobacteriales bacterium]|nr:MAG: iron-containing alcohol dehydrogenase [Sphingobacteriales bacterium]